MPVRTSEAQWEGPLKGGSGTMRFGGGAYDGAYSFSSRFEEGTGTNPEELIAAAHAGCFSMFLAGSLGSAGHEPRRVSTTAAVHLDKVGDGFTITSIDLRTEVEAPGIGEDEFQRLADDAKHKCPVSRLLTGADVNLEAKLL